MKLYIRLLRIYFEEPVRTGKQYVTDWLPEDLAHELLRTKFKDIDETEYGQGYCDGYYRTYHCDEKYVEQEPCGDAVSRDAVCNIVDDIRDCIRVEGYWAVLERLKKLSSVNPQPKTGKWEEDGHNLSDNWIFTGWKCSVCGKHALQDRYDRYLRSDYCPRCGAKMIEPQESEE